MVGGNEMEKREQHLLDTYYDVIGDDYPLMELKYDEDKIRACINEGKDVYEMGYVDLDDDIYY